MKFHLLLVASFLWACEASTAATLSTLSAASAGNDLVTWNTWKGQEFKLSATATSSQITDVSLRLEIVVPNINFVVRIVGSQGSPGKPNMNDIRANLLPTTALSVTALATITFETDPLTSYPPLDPEGSYWLIAGMTAADFDQTNPAGLIRWHYAGANGQDAGAAPGWTVGSLVAYSDTEGGDWVPSVAEPYLFNLTAVAVPEPVSLLGLTVLAMLRRRRRL
jgi:hypothetical protein